MQIALKETEELKSVKSKLEKGRRKISQSLLEEKQKLEKHSTKIEELKAHKRALEVSNREMSASLSAEQARSTQQHSEIQQLSSDLEKFKAIVKELKNRQQDIYRQQFQPE